jgi:hypothetical protein
LYPPGFPPVVYKQTRSPDGKLIVERLCVDTLETYPLKHGVPRIIKRSGKIFRYKEEVQ